MEFVLLDIHSAEDVQAMSAMASAIVREHYDPILGEEQNTYMIEMFQSEKSICEQVKKGYQYYFVRNEGKDVGFIAIIPHTDSMYLSKFYLYHNERHKGYARQTLNFIIAETRKAGLNAIELNVNKYNDAILSYERMGFRRIRDEKNAIGHGYYMDDYVYRLDV